MEQKSFEEKKLGLRKFLVRAIKECILINQSVAQFFP
jgi:hypothetical protein